MLFHTLPTLPSLEHIMFKLTIFWNPDTKVLELVSLISSYSINFLNDLSSKNQAARWREAGFGWMALSSFWDSRFRNSYRLCMGERPSAVWWQNKIISATKVLSGLFLPFPAWPSCRQRLIGGWEGRPTLAAPVSQKGILHSSSWAVSWALLVCFGHEEVPETPLPEYVLHHWRVEFPLTILVDMPV